MKAAWHPKAVLLYAATVVTFYIFLKRDLNLTLHDGVSYTEAQAGSVCQIILI